VKAIRSGKSIQISIYDVLAGDVLHLEPGDVAPADGVFISGYNVQCDESSVTGESDQKKKISGDEVMARIKAGASVDKLDPFIVSGSKVLEGTGMYLVTSVGVHSSYGKLIMAMTDNAEATPTPLQIKLNIMAEQIAKFGCAVALLLFIVLFIKFLAQPKSDHDAPAQKAQNFLQIVIVAITIIVIAVPEGLPLAVTLALAFAMTRMLKDHNLVRVLSSCETMGNATAICSDKTGTLTMNKMTVVAGCLGTACQFGIQKGLINQDRENSEQAASGNSVAVSFSELASLLSIEVKDLLLQSIAVNSTAFEGGEDGQRTFIGSKTETALLSFAKAYLGMGPVNEERANANIVQIFPFDSGRKCMASVVRLPDSTYRMYVKGASEILLGNCTRIVADVTKPTKSVELTTDIRISLANANNKYAIKSLRTIGVVYRDFRSWPPPGAKTLEDDPREAVFEDIFDEMVFLGIVGIQDPLRPGVKEAVGQCQHAGVFVRMVTGDNIGTAKAIAEECGIYTQGGIALEGPEFRKLSNSQMDRIIPQLQVLARSSPEDKRILVERLKELGETVAVTGDGTNDGPALRAADIGFSMGISGTEVAKEASSIILMDDNFSSIVKALEWGRAVNDAVRKFLQVGFPFVRYFVPFADSGFDLVPTYCQHHCSRCHVRVCNSQP
jgi:Ca2+-transporting ATPase